MIITSLLDTDLYKFTMWQTMLHRHPEAQAEYNFVCRNRPVFPLTELIREVNEQLDHLCTLAFTPDELRYLRGLRFIKSDFVDFLRSRDDDSRLRLSASSASQASFAKVWDNNDDAEYDRL